MSTFMTRLAAIGADFNAQVEASKLTVCLYPAKPWHIAEKQRAVAALQHTRSCKRLGLLSNTAYWVELNRVEILIRSALRAHRLATTGV